MNTSIDRADPLADLLCFDLYAASRAVTSFYRPLLAELRLTYPQYLALVVLAADGPLSVSQVADALRLDHGTLTPLLRRMESAGLITRRRSATDERVVQVAVTEAGRAVHGRFDEVQCAVRDALGLSAADARSLQSALRALAVAVAGPDPGRSTETP